MQLLDLRELGFHAAMARPGARREGASLLIFDGQVRRLPDHPVALSLGKAAASDVRFDSEGVSRVHTTLKYYGVALTLEGHSKNGTLLHRPAERRPRVLHFGTLNLEHEDAFRCAVGGSWVRFESYDGEGTLRQDLDTAAPDAISVEDLTRRDRRVVAEYLDRWLSDEDTSNASLATALVVSEETIKTHILHIRRKWGCRDRDEIVPRAFGAGLLPAAT